MAKIKIKKNDTVIVTTGNSKGVKGKVIKVYPSKNRAMVEGANMISKHTKPNAASPQGGIVKQEASIHISNLVCNHLVLLSQGFSCTKWHEEWIHPRSSEFLRTGTLCGSYR
jgi:ribosomal protein L24